MQYRNNPFYVENASGQENARCAQTITIDFGLEKNALTDSLPRS